MSTNHTENIPETDEEAPWFMDAGWRWAFQYIIIWLMPLFLVAGTLLNILCLITIVRSSDTFPKISRRSMIAVTASDIIVLLLASVHYYQKFYMTFMGITEPKAFKQHENDSAAACYFINYFMKYLMNGTPYFNVGLTVERVLAVVMPLKVKRIMTVRNHAILMVFLFLLGSVAPTLWAVVQEYYSDESKCDASSNYALIGKVDPIQSNFDFYVSKVALFTFLLGGCIVVAVTLNRQTLEAKKLQHSMDESKRRKLVSTCMVMIAMNVLFFLSHGPRACMSVYETYYIFPYGPYNSPIPFAKLDLIYEILYMVTFMHNVMDPLAYFMGQGFRTAFAKNFSWMTRLCGGCVPAVKETESKSAPTSVIATGKMA